MSTRSDLNPRSLDVKIQFQHDTATQNSTTGEMSPPVWADFGSPCWAKVDGIKAKERYLAQQITDSTDYTVWIRWRSDITTAMRIKWGARYLNILGIPDNQRRGLFLALFCTEGDSQG